MRVAVVDIGTNSTRLLVADVDGDALTEVERESRVTRLGEGVDRTGALGDAPMARVLAAVGDFRARMDALGVQRSTAVLTSAVRDARNGEAFTARVAEHVPGARTITGDEEAQLTFAGATAERTGDEEVAVIDIGGGSTEVVTGQRGAVGFHVSMQAGVVRLGERHLHDDPPTAAQLDALLGDFRATLHDAVPGDVARAVRTAIAVAGTPTSLASIDLGLDPYDPARTHGHVLTLDVLEAQLERLAALPLAERREVRGLHPDRAPTIVAGAVLLIACLRAFGLDRVEASEHDILRGAALQIPRTGD